LQIIRYFFYIIFIFILLKHSPQDEISKLSGKFYSLIPHKIGQATSVLATPFLIEEKQELLQVWKEGEREREGGREGEREGEREQDNIVCR
jgi:hypothetical protein